MVRYLQDAAGVDPVFLSAAGFSEYRPVESNATLEGRAGKIGAFPIAEIIARLKEEIQTRAA